MLKRFEVTNCKNFKDTVLFDFSDVHDYHFNEICIKDKLISKAIIYGKNSVGKTNLGIALFDITRHLIDAHSWDPSNEAYLNADSELNEAKFKYIFQFDEDEVIYSYKKKSVNLLSYEKLQFNGETVLEYDFENHKILQLDTFLSGSATLNWEFKDSDMSIVRYIANNTVLESDNLLHRLIEFVSRMIWFRALETIPYIGKLSQREGILRYIVKNGLVEELEQFLYENGVQEKLVVKTNPEGEEQIYVQHKKLLLFEKVASSGTKSLVALFFWIKHIDDYSFIWIDEYDAFYHYEVSDNIIKNIRNYEDTQVVITTHNTNIMSNRYMRPDCYFILSKYGLASLCNATDRELREGHNLQKMYLSGEFDEG